MVGLQFRAQINDGTQAEKDENPCTTSYIYIYILVDEASQTFATHPSLDRSVVSLQESFQDIPYAV
jgi:hypothetical protein